MRVVLPNEHELWAEVRPQLQLAADGRPEGEIAALQHALAELFGDNCHEGSSRIAAFAAQQALKVETLFSDSGIDFLPQLERGDERSVQLNQLQALSILSLALFGLLLPSQFESGEPYQRLDFRSLVQHSQVEKLKCLFQYFESCSTRLLADEEWTGNLISFTRRRVQHTATTVEFWMQSDTPLIDLAVYNEGSIDDCVGCLQADFANQYIGGSVLTHGCVQEEIYFLEHPECLVSLMLAPPMLSDEAIVIKGAERFSTHTGYARGFKFASGFHDLTAVDSTGHKTVSVVALDALKYFGRERDQYDRQCILRDVVKCFAAVSEWKSEQSSSTIPRFATGNWGCGAFGGDPRLKSLQQWAACSAAQRPVAYFTFMDERVAYTLHDLADAIRSNSRVITVGDLVCWMVEYANSSAGHDLFNFIRVRMKQTTP